MIEKAIFNTNASYAQKKCFKNFHAPIDLSCIFARLPEPQRLLQLSKSLLQVVLLEESVIKTTETQKSESNCMEDSLGEGKWRLLSSLMVFQEAGKYKVTTIP